MSLCDPANVTPGTAPTLMWTVYGNTGDYGTSYRIAYEDQSNPNSIQGLCLSPTDPTAPSPDLFGGSTLASKIILADCDTSTLQKWNAPPDVQKVHIKDISEK
jgi:hypothetical protein